MSQTQRLTVDRDRLPRRPGCRWRPGGRWGWLLGGQPATDGAVEGVGVDTGQHPTHGGLTGWPPDAGPRVTAHPQARPGHSTARRWPTPRWLPGTSPRPAPRTPRRRARRPVDGAGLAAAWGRAHQRGSRAGRGTGQAPRPGMGPDDRRWRRWAMMWGQARSPVLIMGFDNHMIAGNRACSTFTPTRQNRTMPRPWLTDGAHTPGRRSTPSW